MNKYQEALSYFTYGKTNKLDLCRVESLQELVDRATPMKTTHEATKKESDTCPNCGNVCSTYEKWGSSMVQVTSNYCKFCGQALDWSEE